MIAVVETDGIWAVFEAGSMTPVGTFPTRESAEAWVQKSPAARMYEALLIQNIDDDWEGP